MINSYYEHSANDTFTRYTLGNAKNFLLVNDSGVNSLEFSEDGINVKGTLKLGEWIELDAINCNQEEYSLYIRNKVAGITIPFRLWSW